MPTLTATDNARVPQAQLQASHDHGSTDFLLNAIPGGNTGPGNGLALVRAGNNEQPKFFTWQTIIGGTGSLSALTVNLEGTLDGTNFFQLDQSMNAAGEGRSVAYKPVVGVRANITTSTVSSGSPTVTVYFL